MRTPLAALLCVLLSAPAWAEAPETSLRPLPRPQAEPTSLATKSPVASPVREQAQTDQTQDTLPPLGTLVLLPPSRTSLAIAGLEAKPPYLAEKTDTAVATDNTPDQALSPPADAVRPKARPQPTSVTSVTPNSAASPRLPEPVRETPGTKLAELRSIKPLEPARVPLVLSGIAAATPSLPTASIEIVLDDTAVAPPEGATRPRARPMTVAVTATVTAEMRPRPRPAQEADAPEPKPAQVSALAVTRSLHPEPRPRNLRRRPPTVFEPVVAVPVEPPVRGNRRGSVCGDRSIRGEHIAPIPGRIPGCGLAEPVRITEVDGVRLSTPAKVDCVTAQALRRWVTETVKPNVGRMGGGVSSLKILAHYACRTRNNQRGAKISEHGRGRAVDIGAIILKDGSSITVLNGWRDRRQGPILQALHRGACGVFGTVLGPNSNRYHQDHFHFDTARYRSGPYCR